MGGVSVQVTEPRRRPVRRLGPSQIKIYGFCCLFCAMSICTVLMKTNHVVRNSPAVYNLLFTLWRFHIMSTVAGPGDFVILTTHSSAPWCFERFDVGRWLPRSGRQSVVLSSQVWAAQAEMNSFVDDVCLLSFRLQQARFDTANAQKVFSRQGHRIS